MVNQFFFISATVLLATIIIAGIDRAVAQSTTIAPEEYLGEMAIPEAIKGFDEQKVKEDPICDSSKRPEIDRVKPDEVKPGDKMVVTGRFFGKKKECLYKITIGSEEGNAPTYISDQKLEVTVPDSVKPGMTFLSIESGGGSARSAILVKVEN